MSAHVATAQADSAQVDTTPVRQVLAYALGLAAQSRKQLQALPDTAPLRLTPEQVRAVPATELRARLDEILLSKSADLGLLVLKDCGVLSAIMPEVTELVGFGEGHNRHKDVWKHTLQVIIQAVPRASVRWAALFHDVAKPRTRSIDKDGTVHFLHHAEIGARMFTKLARREKLFDNDPKLQEKIRFLVYHHQRAHQYDSNWTDSATRRFGVEMGEHLDDLMALSRADLTTKRKEKRRRFLAQLKELRTRVEELAAEDSKPKPLPKGLGEALITTFNLPPSKLIGDIRKKLEALVEAGELPLQAEFSVYLDYVREHASEFGLPEVSA